MMIFGAEIPSNRQQPDWLDANEMVEVAIEGWPFIGKAGMFKWADVTSFRLSEDHSYYQQEDQIAASRAAA